jgi:ATP-dependent Clp protease ATP-binding subunit ClpA
MFERFTSSARAVVVRAQVEARELRSEQIGTEHLLLALLAQGDSRTAVVLQRHGLTHRDAVEALAGHLGRDDLDAAALSTLGIDLDAVRDSVEATFGPGALEEGRRTAGRPRGHVPFSPRAKKVLELALREAIALKQKSISDAHIALGVLREGQGLAMKVLHDRGVDVGAVREELVAALRS